MYFIQIQWYFPERRDSLCLVSSIIAYLPITNYLIRKGTRYLSNKLPLIYECTSTDRMYANAFLFSIEPVRCLCFLIHNKMWVILARSQIPWDFFYEFIVAEECWLKVAVSSCVSAVFPFMDLRVCYEEFGLLSTLLYTFISMPLVVLFWAEQILSLIMVVWVGRNALGRVLFHGLEILNQLDDVVSVLFFCT